CTGDTLELDELWSYVLCRTNKVWNWIALSRNTRQVVAFVCGARDSVNCTELRCRLTTGYADLPTCSDYWSSYAEVFDPDTHQSVGKHTGLTNHVERFNASARNRLGRLTRKTLSFSKKQENHEAVLHVFLLQYNNEIRKKLLAR
ncbi:MAG: IS1 family transposase, partial [Shewanella sp.]|nr:IS1 family transposase [Shewanella sp.]